MKATWNTGRKYAADGQIIVAEYAAGAVLFNDTARGICGRIELPNAPRDAGELRDTVMFLYDRGQYDMDMAAASLRA